MQTNPLVCCWLSCVAFLSSAWKYAGKLKIKKEIFCFGSKYRLGLLDQIDYILVVGSTYQGHLLIWNVGSSTLPAPITEKGPVDNFHLSFFVVYPSVICL